MTITYTYISFQYFQAFIMFEVKLSMYQVAVQQHSNYNVTNMYIAQFGISYWLAYLTDN